MSRAHSPSSLSAARIPKITNLREQLDYGDSKLPRCAAFIDDLRVFRRRYSSANLRGTDLWDWKSSEHQEALKQMTASFLDENGYGEVYWPSDPSAANFNSLQYSKTPTFISHTVRKLIFRLNLQQYRNQKYKNKERQSVHEVIDLVDDERNTSPDYANSGMEAPSAPFATNATAQRNTGLFNQNARVPLTTSDSLRQGHDIYDVPTSPDYISEPSITKRKLKAPSKNSPQKRSKIVSLKVGSGRTLDSYHRPIAPMPTRTSPRGRKTAPRVNYTDILDLDQPFTSPISATESTIGHESDIGVGHQRHTVVRQESEIDEDIFDYTRTNPPLEPEESTSPAVTEVSRRATADSNIDPNLEQMSSPAFPMNPPTHHILQQTRPSLPSPSMTPVLSSTNIPPESGRVPPPTRTMSAIVSIPDTNKTLGSSYPSPAPNDASKTSRKDPNASAATAPGPVATSSADSKASIEFNYSIILARTPVYKVKGWQPKGHFLEKSLSELINEIPLEEEEYGTITGLIIRLTGPGADMEVPVERGQDAKYNDTKEDIIEIVKMCLKTHKKANSGRPLVMKFRIEAVREAGVGEDEQDADDVLIF